MSDRSDVIRKVAGLMRLADNAGASDSERESALAMAVKLRLKHGISDHALDLEVAAEETSEDMQFFGHLLFFYGRNIAPHVQTIRDEIDSALAKADKLDPLNRAETYSKLYRDLRDTVEGATWASHGIGLKPKRDETVKALYRQVAYEYAVSHGGINENSDIYRRRMQHEWARDRTASACDLRKDAVERIVGVTEKRFWKEEADAQAAHVCEGCGLDGNEDRDWCRYYEDDEEGKTGRWMHPACKEKEAEAAQ